MSLADVSLVDDVVVHIDSDGDGDVDIDDEVATHTRAVRPEVAGADPPAMARATFGLIDRGR